MIEEAHDTATRVLRDHMDALHRLSAILIERETIDKEQFERLLAGEAEESVFAEPEPPVGRARAGGRRRSRCSSRSRNRGRCPARRCSPRRPRALRAEPAAASRRRTSDQSTHDQRPNGRRCPRDLDREALAAGDVDARQEHAPPAPARPSAEHSQDGQPPRVRARLVGDLRRAARATSSRARRRRAGPPRRPPLARRASRPPPGQHERVLRRRAARSAAGTGGRPSGAGGPTASTTTASAARDGRRRPLVGPSVAEREPRRERTGDRERLRARLLSPREQRVTPECSHPLHGRGERASSSQRRDGDAEPLEAAPELLRAEAARAGNASWSDSLVAGLHERHRRHLDDCEVVAACAEVEQRRDRARVEQRRDGDHERLRAAARGPGSR